ncbi:glucose dehydrogenase [Oceanicola granulosus HTCC2516]|uniref:Glucose dehydrogenase n=1 Tax=Oceanicola granulosus (strain ATCC BAA-861 / DSM 15982 / KCTC 12143 / HTCC2516) TaxID=314256 RepID=Q2CEL7_OCEGH|nr:pyrroloquinoline quinone-dependent dehydrogenase [Oceanicola granulosus]EAR51115.1 glucose dehydrogenase [Oceanicola granulosus HTCC2516]
MRFRDIAALAAPIALATPATAQDWTSFHGNLAAQKFSPADQITPDNVSALERAWEYHTGDVSDGSGDLPPTYFNSTPIYANGTLYIGTPFYRIIALDPATGTEIWTYDTGSSLEQLTQPGLKTRGVSYWESASPSADEPCQKIVYMGTNDAKMHAVDAETGAPCEAFGDGGVLDLNQWNTTNDKWPLSILQPPTIHGDQVVTGWSGYDFRYAEAPPGSVFAFDAQTGEKNWEIQFIPEDIRPRTGTANVWTHMTVDDERGILYMPVSSPSPNFWGGNRTEEIPLATSVTAADIETGEILWSQQLIHHDIWDYDTVAAPTLIDVEKDGETVPALVQTTKQGLFFVFDRVTGEPIWPIEEEDVPPSTVEGEVAAPTQPIPRHPEPILDPDEWPGVWGLADTVSFGACSSFVEDLRNEGLYTPPTDEGNGTLLWPSFAGGLQWGGGSYDPTTGLYIANASIMVDYLQLIPREEYDALSEEEQNAKGSPFSYYAQEGAPYAVKTGKIMNGLGMPCWEPPFGVIAAYDMRTGEQVWKRPFGRTQRWGFYLPEAWGSPNIGGPAQTATGLIFIGASMDSRVRALSAETGDELWSDLLEAPAVSNPAIFVHEGRQYVVFTGGGNYILKPEVSDQVVAYALPE